MRGLSQGSDSGNFTARVMWESSGRGKRGKSTAEKMVEAMGKAADSISLDPKDFGFHMQYLPSAVKRKLFTCFLVWVEYMAERADRNLWMDDEEDRLLCLDAKVLHDAASILRS